MSLPPLSAYESHPPVPPGLQYGVDYTRTEGSFQSKSGQGKLWYAVFWPAKLPKKGLVVFCHGVHEHSERYHHVLAQFAAKGYVAAAHDHLGHGRSEGLPGHVDYLSHFIEDAEELIVLVRTQISEPVPIFVWGQSMGGLVAAHMALRDSRRAEGRSVEDESPACSAFGVCGARPKIDGDDERSNIRLAGVIITSGAMHVVQTPVMKVQAAMAPLLALLAGKSRIVPAVRVEDMSSDPGEVTRMEKDPLTAVTLDLRANLAIQVLRGMEDIMARAKEIRTPLLAFHGTEDKCTYPPGSKAFIEKVSSQDKEFASIEGGWHCLLHEPKYRQQVADQMIVFLERRTKEVGEMAAIAAAAAAPSKA